jgi:hypothetical protein
MDVDKKLVMESGHKAVPLNPAERADLASITKHPGMEVLIGKILETHVKQQMERVHAIKLDDEHRLTKLDAVCSLAQAMRLTAEIIKMEILNNWAHLEAAELARSAAKNETEMTQ